MGNRRGPKRIEGRREPNGRLSRTHEDEAQRVMKKNAELDAAQRDTLEAGLAARSRVHGVKMDKSRDQMAGSTLGRMCLRGELTIAQYDAAMAFAEDSEHYARAVHSPRQPGAVDLNAVHGTNGAENEAAVAKAKDRYKNALAVIQAKQNEIGGSAHLIGALTQAIGRDNLGGEHMLRDLLVGLNALTAHYGLTVTRKAA